MENGMTTVNSRVTRLERAYGLHRTPDDDDALLQRFAETLKLLPSGLLRSFIHVARAIEARAPLTHEQQALVENVEVLWQTGVWPV
jgi:hypothetical protein